MKTILILCLTLLVSTPNAFAARVVRSALPPNDFHLFDNPSRIENIDEKMFNAIIDEAAAYFSPIIAKHDAKLVMVKSWKDSTVNAFAEQVGNEWRVSMFGGLARRHEITPDGFAMVVCHELGHHLGGYAFFDEDWASTEGNSDYFATQACARALWSKPSLANHLAGRTVHRRAQIGCDSAWKEQADRERCYRTTSAGLSLATLLAAIGHQKAPTFETPDPSVVTVTFPDHPKAQCRLDTYFYGALCSKAFDFNVIPGRHNPKGQKTVEAETEAAKYSCTQAERAAFGYRPLCWFKPLMQKRIGLEDESVAF